MILIFIHNKNKDIFFFSKDWLKVACNKNNKTNHSCVQHPLVSEEGSTDAPTQQQVTAPVARTTPAGMQDGKIIYLIISLGPPLRQLPFTLSI